MAGVPSSIIFHKFGSSSRPFTTSVAGTVHQCFYTRSRATSGSSYGVRFQHYLAGAAGSGAALRAYCLAKGASVASAYGAEITAEINSATGSAITGEISATRQVMSVQGSASGTLSVANLVYDTASAKDAGLTSAFIQTANIGSGSATGCRALFRFADAATTDPDAQMVATHADHASTHLVRCLDSANASLWLLATNAH